MTGRSKKILLPTLVFFITLALGGMAVFVAQKIRTPKITEEPPKKFAQAPGQPAPTTPVPSEAAAPANTCNAAECECAFTATAAPTIPSCSLLSITPSEGTVGEEFTANVTCQSGSSAFYVVYLMTRKQGTATKVRLTYESLCTGSGTCNKTFKFTPNATNRGLPALTEAGTYDLWITARSVGPDGTGGNNDDLACSDIPDDLREATTPAACGQKGKTFVLTAALGCTISPSKTTLTAGETTTLTGSVSGGKSPYTLDQWAFSPSGGTFSSTTGSSVTWTSPTSVTTSTTYTASVRVKDSFTPTRTATCQVTLTVNPVAATHKICQNKTCSTVSGTGTDQCQTDANCLENQKPSCGRLEAVPPAGTAPLTVTFTTSGASDPDGSIAVYEFDFGDESGTVVSSNSTSHSYQTTGSFEARVWVRDNLSLRSDLTDFCRVKVTVGTTPTHLECQNQACVRVNGSGSDQCQADANCQTTPTGVTHKVCQNSACRAVSGAGSDECQTNSQCQGVSQPQPQPQPPQATPPAVPTGSREASLLTILGGLLAILVGGWWYTRLDPAWQKFEKGLTRFWEKK